MFHLNPRVHFQKIELHSILIEEEFYGTGIFILDLMSQSQGRLPMAARKSEDRTGEGASSTIF